MTYFLHVNYTFWVFYHLPLLLKLWSQAIQTQALKTYSIQMITGFIVFTPPSLWTETLLSLAKVSPKMCQRNTSSNNIWTLSFTQEIFLMLILNDSLNSMGIYSFSCHLCHLNLTSVWFVHNLVLCYCRFILYNTLT